MKFIYSILLCVVAFSVQAQSLKDCLVDGNLANLKAYVAKNGAKPDRGIHPLLVAAKIGDVATIKDLLGKGADVNAVSGERKRTALMAAAQSGKVEAGKVLLLARASLEKKDRAGATALAIAKKAKHNDFISMLLDQSVVYAETDGPYVFKQGGQVTAFSITGKGSTAKVVKQDASQALTCKDNSGSSFKVTVRNPEQIKSWEYDDDAPVFALSDIEGNFTAMKKLLIAGGVMDASFKWTFGKGHLVMVGDFFDRGDEVTQCLWLAYKLEGEAAKAGGHVHFIIGNHEYMNLSGDTRFVRLKYLANAKLMKKRYMDLYAENTVLGDWLRTKPAMLRIRDMLFVHGSASMALVKSKKTLDVVNATVMNKIEVPKAKLQGVDKLILGKLGPLWYRGIPRNKVAPADLATILKFYKSSTMIIGHTKVSDIVPTHGGQVINLDVDHAKGNNYQKALLVQGGTYYTINTSGSKKKIK